MSYFGVLLIVIVVAASLVTESGAGSFSTTGTVYCSTFECSSYKAQVTKVDFKGYYYGHLGLWYEIIDLCESGASEARAATRALEEFFNSRCPSSSNSTRFDYGFGRIGKHCRIPPIDAAAVYYTCLSDGGPMTAKPTAVTLGTSTKWSTANIVGSEGLTSSASSAKSDGYGDNVFSASTQPRGDQHEAITAEVNPAEDATGRTTMSNAAIASIAACGSVIVIACATILACIQRRKLCLRQREREENRRETNEASAESQSGLLSHSGARDGECLYEFKTYANVPGTDASGPVLCDTCLAESAYATLGTQPCDRVYGSLKA